jgi:uncharacterized LabA/DUF88 family protein
MRVVIFIDGKNFYSGWKDRAEGARVDFEKMSEWIAASASGTTLWGVYYYTGVESGEFADTDKQRQLARFLDDREHDRGFFVKRFPRRAKTVTCSSCGGQHRFTQEKEVDTTMVADMLSLAAVNAFDVAVLVSGDADHAPAVEGVRGLGKKVVVATWGTKGLSPRIRKAAFHYIDLSVGLHKFSTPRTLPPAAAAPRITDARRGTTGARLEPIATDAPTGASVIVPTTTTTTTASIPATDSPQAPAEPLRDVILDELARAEKRFPYVGANYFVTRWKSPRLDADPEVRRRILDRLESERVIEVYTAPDGNRALRRRPKS